MDGNKDRMGDIENPSTSTGERRNLFDTFAIHVVDDTLDGSDFDLE